MTWSKLAGFCSLKAIAVACFLTPVTVPATGITAAHAQVILIPNFPAIRFDMRGPRPWGYRQARRGGRHKVATRRKGGGGQQQEASSSSSSSSSSQSLSAPKTANRGFRGNTD